VNGQTFEVEVLSDPRKGQVQVRVDGTVVRVDVVQLPEPQPPGASRAESGHASGTPPVPGHVPPAPRDHGTTDSNLLTAPLPGTIIGIAVQVGQTVSVGDELLVIEAMKMNNRIRSPRNGTIDAVLVKVGQKVSHGEPLLTWVD
jgi:biotin carboxyl carrier protein